MAEDDVRLSFSRAADVIEWDPKKIPDNHVIIRCTNPDDPSEVSTRGTGDDRVLNDGSAVITRPKRWHGFVHVEISGRHHGAHKIEGDLDIGGHSDIQS